MKHFFCLLFSFIITAFTVHAQTTIKSSDTAHIHYMGRVEQTKDATTLWWPGTSVKINFRGAGVRATLKDQLGLNYFKVIVDGRIVKTIHPDSLQKTYDLVSNLTNTNHTLELFKRTEWDKGKTLFYGFTLDKHSNILPAPVSKKRKIEFFGNSITCGYAVLDSSGKDRATAEYEDNYVSYADITARHFDAEYYCTSKSGIGVLVSWFPIIMPEMYNRLDPTNPYSRWDFSKYTPDVVVINVFQNDAWIVKQPENTQFKFRFGDKAPSETQIITAYEELVEKIRHEYPKAQIICALGNMDATKEGSPWPGYVQKAVTDLKDPDIYTCIFPYKGTPGHPSIKEQRAMADQLIKFIDQHIKW